MASGSRPALDPDRRAYKTEFAADLIFQKALIGEVKFYIAVGENNERRRGDGCLGHVENAGAARERNGGAAKIHSLEKAVHLAGGDAFVALAGEFLNRGKNLFHAPALLSGDEHHGRVAQEFQHPARLLLKNTGDGRRFAVFTLAGQKVPLIDDQQYAAATLVRVAADGSVAGGPALRRI